MVTLTGCRDRADELAREAPALAKSDLRIERIAVAGIVSDAPGIEDTNEHRERWSFELGNRFARDRFGGLPIVDFRQVRTILGPDDHRTLLDRFRVEGRCDTATLGSLRDRFEGQARFVVFGRIQEQAIRTSTSADKDKKTKTFKTTRTVSVRLHFYDLADRTLVWSPLTQGSSTSAAEYDDSNLLESSPNEGLVQSLGKSIVNMTAKPEMTYPQPPDVGSCLTDAFDRIGEYLKPPKQR